MDESSVDEQTRRITPKLTSRELQQRILNQNLMTPEELEERMKQSSSAREEYVKSREVVEDEEELAEIRNDFGQDIIAQTIPRSPWIITKDTQGKWQMNLGPPLLLQRGVEFQKTIFPAGGRRHERLRTALFGYRDIAKRSRITPDKMEISQPTRGLLKDNPTPEEVVEIEETVANVALRPIHRVTEYFDKRFTITYGPMPEQEDLARTKLELKEKLYHEAMSMALGVPNSNLNTYLERINSTLREDVAGLAKKIHDSLTEVGLEEAPQEHEKMPGIAMRVKVDPKEKFPQQLERDVISARIIAAEMHRLAAWREYCDRMLSGEKKEKDILANSFTTYNRFRLREDIDPNDIAKEVQRVVSEQIEMGYGGFNHIVHELDGNDKVIPLQVPYLQIYNEQGHISTDVFPANAWVQEEDSQGQAIRELTDRKRAPHEFVRIIYLEEGLGDQNMSEPLQNETIRAKIRQMTLDRTAPGRDLFFIGSDKVVVHAHIADHAGKDGTQAAQLVSQISSELSSERLDMLTENEQTKLTKKKPEEILQWQLDQLPDPATFNPLEPIAFYLDFTALVNYWQNEAKPYIKKIAGKNPDLANDLDNLKIGALASLYIGKMMAENNPFNHSDFALLAFRRVIDEQLQQVNAGNVNTGKGMILPNTIAELRVDSQNIADIGHTFGKAVDGDKRSGARVAIIEDVANSWQPLWSVSAKITRHSGGLYRDTIDANMASTLNSEVFGGPAMVTNQDFAITANQTRKYGDTHLSLALLKGTADDPRVTIEMARQLIIAMHKLNYPEAQDSEVADNAD